MDDLTSTTLRDRRVVALKLALLSLWALVSFGVCYFARSLEFTVLGWPFGYWISAQGALIAFTAMLAFHAWAMKRLAPEDAQPPQPREEAH